MPNSPDNRSAPKASDILYGKRKNQIQISKSPSGILLRNFLDSMYRQGDNAEEEYQRLQKELTDHAEEVLVEIARASNDCVEQDYAFRLALVQVAAALRHPGALPFFASIVKTPIPSEKSQDPHSFSTVAEETIIRTMAIDGIAEHAKSGNESALNLLIECIKLPSFSIRRAAIQGIFSTNQADQLKERIKDLLPEDQHFLLNLRRVSVREVPQVKDPTSHLSTKLPEGRVPTPPNFPEENENKTPKAY